MQYPIQPSQEIAEAKSRHAAEDRKRHSIWNSLFAPVMDLTLGNDNRVPHYDHMLVRSPSSMSLEHGRDPLPEAELNWLDWLMMMAVRS